VWLECGSRNACKIGWQCWRVRSIIEHECAIAAKRSNEESEFKEHVIACNRLLYAPGYGEIIRG